MIKDWSYKDLKYSEIVHREMYGNNKEKLGYIEYMIIDKSSRHMKSIPFKRVVNRKHFYNHVLPNEEARGRYCVELLSSDIKKSPAKKPSTLRGVNMLESFRADKSAKTIQVFIYGDDVYVKDNTYAITTKNEITYNGWDSENGIKVSHYGIVGWFKFPMMNSSRGRPEKAEFASSCREVLGINEGQSINLKWEIIYENVVRIVDKHKVRSG